MDDDALAGTRVLVIGGNREAAESIRSQLTAAGSPSVDLVPSLELVAAQAAAARPQVVLSLGDTDPGAVRARLAPLGLDAGPPVVPVSELAANGEPLGSAGVSRLRMLLEHRAMRVRLGELEAIVASQALSAFRDTEAIRVDTLERLARAAEYRDDNSPEHTQRVAALAARMARHLGQDDRSVWLVRQAAPARRSRSSRGSSASPTCSTCWCTSARTRRPGRSRTRRARSAPAPARSSTRRSWRRSTRSAPAAGPLDSGPARPVRLKFGAAPGDERSMGRAASTAVAALAVTVAVAVAGCGAPTAATKLTLRPSAGGPAAIEATDGRLGDATALEPGGPLRELSPGGLPDLSRRDGAPRRDGVAAGAACAGADLAASPESLAGLTGA